MEEEDINGKEICIYNTLWNIFMKCVHHIKLESLQGLKSVKCRDEYKVVT